MRKPTPIDTTTLNYNWQIWETNAFSIYTKETDEVDEKSAQEAVAAVLRYLSRVGLLRYNCHSGYLSSVVQENELSNVLTPAGGIFRRFVEPGQEVEYGQKLGVILDPFTAEVEAEITCPTSGVIFFALKKPLTTEHEVAFKVIRRLSVSRRKKQRGSRPEDLPRVGAFISRDIQDSGKIFKKVANRAGNLPCSPFYKMVS